MIKLSIWLVSIILYVVMIFMTYGFIWVNHRQAFMDRDGGSSPASMMSIVWPAFWIGKVAGKCGDYAVSFWSEKPKVQAERQ